MTIHPLYFWASLTRVGDCWEWSGQRNREGYGSTPRVQGFRGQAPHRVAWMLANDAIAIPDGRMICHHCDNPPCCNPAHLYCGTGSDNAKDYWRRQAPHYPKKVRKLRRGQPIDEHDRVAMPGQVAQFLGVTTRRVRQLGDLGELEFYQFPTGHRRYLVASVRALAADLKRSA